LTFSFEGHFGGAALKTLQHKLGHEPQKGQKSSSGGTSMPGLADRHEAVRNHQASLAGTPNVEVYEGLKPQLGDFMVDKTRYSAFYGTNLEAIL
jgi:nicotinamidase-related amidase